MTRRFTWSAAASTAALVAVFAIPQARAAKTTVSQEPNAQPNPYKPVDNFFQLPDRKSTRLNSSH